MNLALLEPSSQNYPNVLGCSLDYIPPAVCCAINKFGTLLAIGCSDGRVIIWEFITRTMVKMLLTHVGVVCSVSWSRNGHKLVTGSADKTVRVWDVSTGKMEYEYHFPKIVLKVQFDPRNNERFVVSVMQYAAILVKIMPKSLTCLIFDADGDLNIFATFDRQGKHIYTGNGKGKILVLDVNTLEIVASFRIIVGTSNVTAIKSIEFARKGDKLLINTSDKTIRIYDSKEIIAAGIDSNIQPIKKLQDLVNKSTFKTCCFSGDGDYICAGSTDHPNLYIWELSDGILVQILYGKYSEIILDIAWNPVRIDIVSVSSSSVSIWTQNHKENWNPYLPDFIQIDKNIEYQERESEFDIMDEDKSIDSDKQSESDTELDVVTIEPIAAFYSSDEENADENALLLLINSPEIENPEYMCCPSDVSDSPSDINCDDYNDDSTSISSETQQENVFNDEASFADISSNET